MTRRTTTRSALMLAGASMLALTLGVASARAQQQPTPPEHYTLDPRGVDLVQGTFNHAATDVVIGQPGQGGMSFGRIWANGGWRDTLSGTIKVVSTTYTVSLGGVSEVFTLSGGVYTPVSNTGATLTQSGGLFTFTLSDGTVATYSTTYSGNTSPYDANNAALMTITTPDGEVTTLTWNGISYCSFRDLDGECLTYANAVRVDAVSNNRGYLIKFVYGMDAVPYDTQELRAEWLRRVSATGVNLAVDFCSTGPGACTGLTRTWPSATYVSGDFGGDITSVTDQSSRVTNYSYASGQLSGVRYPGSGSDDIAVTYASGKVSSVADASGTWTYGYSDLLITRTTTVSGPLGQGLTATSNLNTSRMTGITDALSNATTYAYDGQLRLERITNPEGDYVELDYDARGNVVQTTSVPKSGSGLSNIVVSATYPMSCANPVTCNLPTSTTDARGNVTDYVWNATHGGLESVTLPAPAISADRPQTRYTYSTLYAWYKNSGGTLVQAPTPITLPTQVSACVTGVSPGCLNTANEVRTTLTYGAPSTANNLLPTTIAAGAGDGSLTATTALTYTSDGDLMTVDGPLAGASDTTRYRYDTARRLVGVVGPDPDGGGALLNPAQRITYDSRGLVTLVEQGTTPGQSDGDWANFVTLQRQAATYDAWRRPLTTAVQDSGGTTHQLAQVSYDAAGRVDCSAVRMNPATFGSLPGSACTLATTGGYGPDRITKAVYDALGRPSSTTTSVGLTGQEITESVTYTDNGLPATLTDGQGNVSGLEYDGFDRLHHLYYPEANGSGTSTTDYEEYGYDAAGNVVFYRTRDEDITFASTFDNLNRRTLFDGPSTALDVAYTYDNLGRMLTATGPHATTLAYDALGRLTKETSPFGDMAYQYDLAGRRTRQTWPDSFYVTQDWNLSNQVTAIKHAGTTQIIGYAYDNLGRRTGLTRGNGVTTTYGYDGISRLTSLTHDVGGTAADVAFAYTHNPAGQIVTRVSNNDAYSHAFGSTATQTSVIDGLNRVAEINTVALDYDLNSNITDDTVRTYDYDALSRLTEVNSGASTLNYDALGRLYEYDGTAGGRFLYDGVEIAGFGNVGSTTLGTRFVRGPWPDEIVANFTSSGSTPAQYWAYDERGSLINLSNGSTGASTVVNTYDEYGVPASGNLGRMQYTGQLWLPDFGLYHYKARAYHPGIGRFMQTDPIGYAAGANLYVYVGDDPVNFMDFLGLQESPTTQVGDVIVTGRRLTGRVLIGLGTAGSAPLFNERVHELEDIIVTAARDYRLEACPEVPAYQQALGNLLTATGVIGDVMTAVGLLTGNLPLAGAGKLISMGSDVGNGMLHLHQNDLSATLGDVAGFAISRQLPGGRFAVPTGRFLRRHFGSRIDPGINRLGQFTRNNFRRRLSFEFSINAGQQNLTNQIVSRSLCNTLPL